jgi:hypothetical protein
MLRNVFLFVLFVVFVGCIKPRPTTDTTDPEIVITVSRGRGGNIFRSVDGRYEAPNNCIKVPDMPTQLIMIAGDSGGVAFASVRAFGGRIVSESVEVAPRAPEASFSIRSESGSGILDVRLTPPSPGAVRTGASAVFEVDGSLPISITATAGDYAGNAGHLAQFEIRSLDDAVVCRGD